MGVVCRYFTIFAALNSVFLLAQVLAQHDHGHDHHSHGHDHGEGAENHDHIDPFLTVKTHVVNAVLENFESENEAAIISYDELDVVVSTLLNRINCTERVTKDDHSTNCSVCASVLTDHVFDVLESSKEDGLQEAQFEKAAVVLLVRMSERNLALSCSSEGNLGSYEDYLTSLMSREGTPERITQEEMKLLLLSFSEYYKPQTHGKCFSTESLFEDVYDGDLGASLREMQHLSPLIVAYLLEGYCIGEADFPDPESFIQDVIALYGHDGVIPLEDFKLIMSQLGLGSSDDHSGHDHGEHDEHSEDVHGGHDHGDHDHSEHDHSDHDHHDHAGHDHRRKRAVQHNHDHDHHDHDHHDHGHAEDVHVHDTANVSRIEAVAHSCFSAEELMMSHGLHPEDGLTEKHLVLVCPALLQQQLSGGCSHHDHGVGSEYAVGADAYLYGTLSVFVVSLCAVIGGCMLPILGDDRKDMVFGLLIAMAVSTLTGDALIHLIPMATGLHVHEGPHDHGAHGGHDHGAHDHDLSYIWKTFTTLMSIYAFFLLEVSMSHCGSGHHTHTHGHAEANSQPMALEQARFESVPTTETSPEDPVGQEKDKKIQIFQFGSLPIMILLSDAFHNFCDGLAMGASFAASIGTGLSTSFAIFCHELPHELGDLAILLKSGMSLKWALLLNFLSALTCFLGFFIGIAVGSTLIARQWILSITAGMFLYVGLVDMMPQILKTDKSKHAGVIFILQNVGFLIGAAVILGISFLEEALSH